MVKKFSRKIKIHDLTMEASQQLLLNCCFVLWPIDYLQPSCAVQCCQVVKDDCFKGSWVVQSREIL